MPTRKPRTRKHLCSLRLGCREWHADTKKELDEKLHKDLAALLQWDNFTPIIVFSPYENEIAILHCSVEGEWGYYFVQPLDRADILPGMSQSTGGQCGKATRHQALCYLRRHLAQKAYGKDPKSDHESWLQLGDTEGLSQHRFWTAWQERYAAAKRLGKNDTECREYANSTGE